MTIQVDTGPGVEDWRSQKFGASIGVETAYVYGYSELTNQASVTAWGQGSSPEQSWLTVPADESVTLSISLTSGSVTSATVYPKNAGFTQVISGGQLILTVDPNTRLRVEVNGNRAECLHVFTTPIHTEPTASTDYTTLSATVTGFATGGGSTTFTCAGGHNLVTGQRVLIKSDDTRPSTIDGVLPEYELLWANVLNATDFELSLTDGGAAIELTDNGLGTITVATGEYTDTVNSLVFPAGYHKIGRLFRIGSNVDVFLEAGAVLTGNFDIILSEGVTFRGPGVLAGNFADYVTEVEALSFTEKQLGYAMFVGYDAGDFGAENSIEGLTIVGCPFYVNYVGIWSFRNAHVFACWHGESDGFSPGARTSANRVSEIVDCFLFVADDAVKLTGFDSETVSGTFAISTANSPYMLGYFSTVPNDGYTRTITDCHAMHLGVLDTEADISYPYDGMNSIVKCWVDGWEADATDGIFNVTFENFKVWGPMPSRFMSIGNRAYPFASGPRDQAGLVQDWVFSNVETEFVPGQISQIIARDADNAPNHITFSNVVFGGERIYSTNYINYFEVAADAYALYWDTYTEVVQPPTAQSYGEASLLSELTAVNTMLTAVGMAPTNTLDGLISADVATAKHILKEVRMGMLLQGWKFNTEPDYTLGPQPDGRIKVPLRTLRVEMDPHSYQGPVDPVQRGQYLYDNRSHSYTWTRSLKLKIITELSWSELPEVARRYVEARATRVFADRMEADQLRQRATLQDELFALTTLKQNETDTGNFTMLSSPMAFNISRRWR